MTRKMDARVKPGHDGVGRFPFTAHSRVSGNLDWVPAFAGTSGWDSIVQERPRPRTKSGG
jgi:hypothetical protein